MAKVILDKIQRQFNHVTAIEDITFEVPDGEFWVLVGPSGCGKSTILRTIAGLETASTGKLFIGDKLMNDVPARQRDVAMVFQNYALYPHMTVGENIAFGLKMRRMDTKIISQRVDAVARSLSLSHLLERKPKQLSGGQQQRVALGRAIARQPQVFLLDEPLSNLDAQLRDDTRAELKQLHHNLGITTVYVTHDQVEAMTLADKIVILNGGRIQQIGEPQAIYAHPANRMVATFLGNPPMNIIPATYRDNTFDIQGQTLPCPVSVLQKLQLRDGQKVDLGMRPEDISIQPAIPQDPELGLTSRLRSMSTLSEAEGLIVEVRVVEPLGRETLIRGIIPGNGVMVNVQLGANVKFRVGDKLSLDLDLDKLFVFDSATGEKLYP